MGHTPFFSIVVVSFNAAELIRPTIDSVLQQTFEDYEIVVKDACSTDGTLDRVPEDPRIRVYCTKDGGIYEGMNEAVTYTTGEYILFLNCGDLFHDDGVLQAAWEKAKGQKEPALLYGDRYRDGVLYKQPSKVTPFFLYRTPICHQTEFFHRSLFDGEMYDLEYRLLADHEFTLRAFTRGVPFVYIPHTICDYEGGGMSESPKWLKRKYEESDMILTKYYTRKQRMAYDLKIALTFRKLRIALTSDKSPRWVRKAYSGLLKLVNR